MGTEPPPPPAKQRVLDITELLEEILLQLDIKTLLFSQRVNKRFKSVIDSSVRLQEALFFLQGPEHGINPLLVSRRSTDSLYHLSDSHNGLHMCWRSNSTDEPGAQVAKPASWQRMLLKRCPMVEKGAGDNKHVRLIIIIEQRKCLSNRSEVLALHRDEPGKTMGEYEKMVVARFEEVLPDIFIEEACDALKDEEEGGPRPRQSDNGPKGMRQMPGEVIRVPLSKSTRPSRTGCKRRPHRSSNDRGMEKSRRNEGCSS